MESEVISLQERVNVESHERTQIMIKNQIQCRRDRHIKELNNFEK